MKLLAFDTSTSICVVALVDTAREENNQVIGIQQTAKASHGQVILDAIHHLLQQFNLQLNDLDAIAYGRGPGSLTGVRIACSIAQGLSFGANLPVIPISSLALLAQSAWFTHQSMTILVAMDARMQEVYFGNYIINSQYIAELQGQEKAIKIEPFSPSEWVLSSSGLGVGNAWSIYDPLRTHYEQHLIKIDTDQPIEPHALAALGQHYFNQGQLNRPESALPLYLR